MQKGTNARRQVDSDMIRQTDKTWECKKPQEHNTIIQQRNINDTMIQENTDTKTQQSKTTRPQQHKHATITSTITQESNTTRTPYHNKHTTQEHNNTRTQ